MTVMEQTRDPKQMLTSIYETALLVITRPVDFYRQMPRSGGYVEPLIFMVALSFVAGLVRSLFSLLGLGPGGAGGLGALIIVPVAVAIFGFVGAGIMFLIWKFMGSEQPYEVAYRCTAYAAAISPLTSLAHPIPYLGALVGIAWGMYLLLIASTEVHNIEPKKAQMIIGGLAVIFALLSLSAEYSARKLSSRMAHFGTKMEQMSPEEAGQKMGEFMKGLQKGSKE